MNRRGFLSGATAAAGWMATGGWRAMAQPAITAGGVGTNSGPGSFDYIFLTDTHLEPELSGADGCAMAFRKAAGFHAEFAIHGGDHVFDALAVDKKRADSLFDQYAQTEEALGL